MFDEADLKTLGELINQGIQTFAQSHGIISGTSKQASETVFEDVATGERLTKQAASEENINYMNMKQTYDLYQHINVDGIGRNRVHFDKMMATAQSHTERLYAISEQAVLNGGLGANLVNNNTAQGSNLSNNQAAAHRDIATNEQWNLSEANLALVSILKGMGTSDTVIAEILARLPNDEEA